MSKPNFSLEGKVAIVTGAKRGIGKEIALTFAEAGADVAVCTRVVEDGRLDVVAKEIQKLGRRSLAIQVDISQKADVDKMVQKVMNELGVIDILVNNAAIIIRAKLLEHCEDDWDKIMNTDLKGYYLCSRAVAQRMVEIGKGGNIINVASLSGMKASPNQAAYCIAKAGVVMLTRVLAMELASDKIRVNDIAPGAVKTELNESLWKDPKTLEWMEEEAGIPLGYAAQPSDIAGAALFLASDASSYITGTTIVVDGGVLA